jgi:hypothetical protein
MSPVPLLNEISGVLNRAGSEAKNLDEFFWLVEMRLPPEVTPEQRQRLVNRQLLATMYGQFKKHGTCVELAELRRQLGDQQATDVATTS